MPQNAAISAQQVPPAARSDIVGQLRPAVKLYATGMGDAVRRVFLTKNGAAPRGRAAVCENGSTPASSLLRR
jgi:hypothetical protein